MRTRLILFRSCRWRQLRTPRPVRLAQGEQRVPSDGRASKEQEFHGERGAQGGDQAVREEGHDECCVAAAVINKNGGKLRLPGTRLLVYCTRPLPCSCCSIHLSTPGRRDQRKVHAVLTVQVSRLRCCVVAERMPDGAQKTKSRIQKAMVMGARGWGATNLKRQPTQ